jgi:predicted  nucleic acid-binding Zn-ribbon protein
LKEQLSLLIELQKAESEINKINIKCKNLPEEIAKLEEAFRVFEAGLEEDRKKFEDTQKAHREGEEKLKKGQEALKKGKERLNDVKTNKEYQAVLKEIEAFEKKNSETEDQIISLLEAVDKAKAEFKIKEKEMASYKQRYGETKKNMEAELHSLDDALETCRQKSGKLRGKISAELLKKYEAIKSLHNTLAVVAVWKEVCEGCYMNLPPQLYIELQRSTELHMCPNCNRIIYWYNQSEEKK